MKRNVNIFLSLGLALSSFGWDRAVANNLTVDDLNLIDERLYDTENAEEGNGARGGGGNRGGGNRGGGFQGGGNRGGGNHGGGFQGGGNRGGGNHGGGFQGGGNRGGGNRGGGFQGGGNRGGGHQSYGGNRGGYNGGYRGGYYGGYGTTTVTAPMCWLTATPSSVYVGDTIDLTIQISGTYNSATIDNYPVTAPVGILKVRPDRPGTFTSVGRVSGPGGSRSCTVSYAAY